MVKDGTYACSIVADGQIEKDMIRVRQHFTVAAAA